MKNVQETHDLLSIYEQDFCESFTAERESAPPPQLRRVSLCRAFKERSRLARRISDCVERIIDENVVPEECERSIDVRKEFAEYMAMNEKLIALRQVISRANAGITDKLVELTEVKAMLTSIKKLASRGTRRDYSYSSSSTELKEEMKKAEFNEMADSLLMRLHRLQDEIDEFNARTFIEFEF